MRNRYCRFLTCLIFSLCIFQVILIAQNKSEKQNNGQAKFYIENQPKSPVLIRDLEANILPDLNNSENQIKISFYVQNRTKKKIKYYGVQEIQSPSDCKNESRFITGNLKSGESRKMDFTYSRNDMTSITVRINFVRFADGTKWESKCSESSRPVLSKGVTAVRDTRSKQSQLVLRKEFQTAPFFADKILNVIDMDSKTIDGIEVKVKKHELKTLRLEMLESCSLERDNYETAHDENDFDIDEIYSYEFDNKIFAYEIPNQAVTGKEGYEIGVGFVSIYVDEDGNNNFKLQCEENDEVSDLKVIPKWIKDLASFKLALH
jgi:hypothetical protein